jgi:hypothetical protein
LPRARRAVDRDRLQPRLERERRIGGDARAALDTRQVAARGERRHAVLAPEIAAELDPRDQVVQQRRGFELQPADTQFVQCQRERQAQRLRFGDGCRRRCNGRGTELQVFDRQAVDHQADPGTVVRPPGPARIAPGQALQRDAARSDLDLQAFGTEGAAEDAPGRLRHLGLRDAREQPCGAARRADEPHHAAAGQQQQCQHRGNDRQQPDAATTRSSGIGSVRHDRQNAMPTEKCTRQRRSSSP